MRDRPFEKGFDSTGVDKVEPRLLLSASADGKQRLPLRAARERHRRSAREEGSSPSHSFIGLLAV